MSRVVLPILAVLCLLGGCDSLLPSAPESESVLAEPIEDLSPSQLATHLAGDEEFARVFGPDSGLGPIFVAASCESCHAGDGKGHPLTTLTRFGRDVNGQFDHMLDKGGPQLQHRSIAGYPAEEIPGEATGVTRLMPPAVTGLGFLEAVDDATILALSDPDDLDGDGISGVPNWVLAPDYVSLRNRVDQDGRYIGKFGKKASALDLTHQTVSAYLQDMGITSDQLSTDLHNPAAGQATGDNVADPEVSSAVVNNVVFYIRTLKVPPQRDGTSVENGLVLFRQIGCNKCHVESLTTSDSDIDAISNKEFRPYTDLLLHDMGSELDDHYTEGSALSSEWRTAPLWGVGLAEDSQGGSAFYLHDGRASTLEESIALHGGEGSASRSNFDGLTDSEQESIISFLKSL